MGDVAKAVKKPKRRPAAQEPWQSAAAQADEDELATLQKVRGQADCCANACSLISSNTISCILMLLVSLATASCVHALAMCPGCTAFLSPSLNAHTVLT